LVSLKTDTARLASLTAKCTLAEADVDAPKAKSSCSGSGTSITAIPDVTFPITSDTIITWTYISDGDSITQMQQVTITDVTKPEPDKTTLDKLTGTCEVTSLTAPTATDNCTGKKITATTATNTPITASTTVTWTYTDDAGNDTIQTQQIVIENNMPPEPNEPTLQSLENCSPINSLITPKATDNCSGTITATTVTTTPIMESTTIAWAYEDASGNTATQTQQVTIITNDTIAPVPDEPNLMTITEARELSRVATPSAKDNCSGEVRAATDTSFPITASTIITWTYTDDEGNTTTQTQQVTITEDLPLNASEDAIEVSVFPNPSGRYFEIRSPVESSVSILDLNGRLLKESTTNTKVDAAFLRSGMYLIQLPGGSLLKFVKK